MTALVTALAHSRRWRHRWWWHYCSLQALVAVRIPHGILGIPSKCWQYCWTKEMQPVASCMTQHGTWRLLWPQQGPHLVKQELPKCTFSQNGNRVQPLLQHTPCYSKYCEVRNTAEGYTCILRHPLPTPYLLGVLLEACQLYLPLKPERVTTQSFSLASHL
jgi:hypothetical protein